VAFLQLPNLFVWAVHPFFFGMRAFHTLEGFPQVSLVHALFPMLEVQGIGNSNSLAWLVKRALNHYFWNLFLLVLAARLR
jgi:hypothetical protein